MSSPEAVKVQRLVKAAQALDRRNAISIYDSSGRSLYPDFIGVVRKEYDELCDALAEILEGAK